MSVDSYPIAAGPLATVTALPAAPYDGQECYYLVDASQGIIWHLRYRAASGSTYKWEVIGAGPALFSFVAAQEPTSSGVFSAGDLATVGPAVTVPLAGDYDVEIGSVAVHSTAGQFMAMSFKFSAADAVDADYAVCHEMLANMAQQISTMRRKTIAAAAQPVTAKYRTSSATAQFSNRWLRVTPVRVG